MSGDSSQSPRHRLGGGEAAGDSPEFVISSIDSSATASQTKAYHITPVRQYSAQLPRPDGQIPVASSDSPARPPRLHRLAGRFRKGGKLAPFRLLDGELRSLRRGYRSDWTVFNQLVLASAVYVLSTNILPATGHHVCQRPLRPHRTVVRHHRGRVQHRTMRHHIQGFDGDAATRSSQARRIPRRVVE